MAALFTEVVSRTFTAGVLAGLTIEARIPRVSFPREVGSVHVVVRPVGGTSPYRDKIVAVERWKP